MLVVSQYVYPEGHSSTQSSEEEESPVANKYEYEYEYDSPTSNGTDPSADHHPNAAPWTTTSEILFEVTKRPRMSLKLGTRHYMFIRLWYLGKDVRQARRNDNREHLGIGAAALCRRAIREATCPAFIVGIDWYVRGQRIWERYPRNCFEHFSGGSALAIEPNPTGAITLAARRVAQIRNVRTLVAIKVEEVVARDFICDDVATRATRRK